MNDYSEFIEQQLAVWPLAKQNYLDLGKTKRKIFNICDFQVAVQCNPARIRSTGASVDKESIDNRPCFLCKKNRPTEQFTSSLLSGWDILVNPFPIFPVHFTIASQEHIPQAQMPLDMVTFVEKVPDLVAFYNGAHAGASAPDHLHFQATLKSELPILQIAEKYHESAESSVLDSADMPVTLPFRFFSFIIRNDRRGMYLLDQARKIVGKRNLESDDDPGLVNAFVWFDKWNWLRIVIVPRKAHRPSCYPGISSEVPVEKTFTISPGAVDMSGIIITPVAKDFENITPVDIEKIYSEVGWK